VLLRRHVLLTHLWSENLLNLLLLHSHLLLHESLLLPLHVNLILALLLQIVKISLREIVTLLLLHWHLHLLLLLLLLLHLHWHLHLLHLHLWLLLLLLLWLQLTDIQWRIHLRHLILNLTREQVTALINHRWVDRHTDERDSVLVRVAVAAVAAVAVVVLVGLVARLWVAVWCRDVLHWHLVLHWHNRLHLLHLLLWHLLSWCPSDSSIALRNPGIGVNGVALGEHRRVETLLGMA